MGLALWKMSGVLIITKVEIKAFVIPAKVIKECRGILCALCRNRTACGTWYDPNRIFSIKRTASLSLSLTWSPPPAVWPLSLCHRTLGQSPLNIAWASQPNRTASSHVQNFGSRGFMPVYPRPKMSQWPWATLMSMHALLRMDFALKQANNGWSNYLTRDQKGLLQTNRFAGWRTSIVARPGIPICQKVRLTPKVWSVCQESLCTAGDGGICIVFLTDVGKVFTFCTEVKVWTLV